ncbi:MAG: hypothetical protein MZV63_34280 [Marinilabiliales bacterium]|nr:hypothetical protein [Marinilabiliales bacterium]
MSRPAAARWSTRSTGTGPAAAAWTIHLRCPECETRRERRAGSRRRRGVQPRALSRRPGDRPRGRPPDAPELRGRGGEDRRRPRARPHPADGLLVAVSAPAPRPPLFVSHTPATTTTAAAPCAEREPLPQQDVGARHRHDRGQVDEHAHPVGRQEAEGVVQEQEGDDRAHQREEEHAAGRLPRWAGGPARRAPPPSAERRHEESAEEVLPRRDEQRRAAHEQPPGEEDVDGGRERRGEHQQVPGERAAAAAAPAAEDQRDDPPEREQRCRPTGARSLRSRREKIPRRATKMGIVASRIAASEALVRAMPVFSKLK